MKDNESYTQILGIQLPWQITDVTLDMQKERFDIYVEWPTPTDSQCPICKEDGKENVCKIYDRFEERVWRLFGHLLGNDLYSLPDSTN